MRTSLLMFAMTVSTLAALASIESRANQVPPCERAAMEKLEASFSVSSGDLRYINCTENTRGHSTICVMVAKSAEIYKATLTNGCREVAVELVDQ
jgi:hypothetical protein